MRRPARAALLALSLTLFAPQLAGAVPRYLGLEEHVGLSQAIVRATATDRRDFTSELDGKKRSDRTFRVIESWKGGISRGQTVTVRMALADEEPETGPGAAEVILFLVFDESGTAYLTAAEQSLWYVTRDVSGAWAQRHIGGRKLQMGEKILEMAPEAPIPLDLLENAVRSLATRPPDPVAGEGGEAKRKTDG